MKRLLTVLGLSVAVLLGGFAWADEPASPSLTRIVERKEVRIGMSGNQPPFTVKNKDGEPLPFIVRKSDGGLNYATSDLATLIHRIERLGAKRLIYVVGLPQKQHFPSPE